VLNAVHSSSRSSSFGGFTNHEPKKGDAMGQPEKVLNDAVTHAAHREGKYLTFSLGGEEYGIGILRIREIIGMLPITAVPEVPHFVKGVINLRGKVIPVIDLRLRFGMADIGYTERTCIIVVEIRTSAGLVPMGIVVDSVSEVLNIKSEDIEDAPGFGASQSTEFILGMAKMGRGVKILLDISKILGSEEVEQLKLEA
jgi:purine-binding chemotaxis protein CheW